MVFIIVLVGNTALIIGLYSCHSVWTCYCVLRNFGDLPKLIIMLMMLVPILLWPVASAIGTVLTGLVFEIALPLIATFEPIREGVPNKLARYLKDGTWSSIKAACLIVREFENICFHSYFSVMDGMLEARGETLMDIRSGCLLAGIVGVLVDMPMLTLIVIYKVPVMLFKGWRQLIRDLIGRSGILSSLSLGCYAAAVAYQENSMKSGLLYVIACISIYDEFTNDFLDMGEGSCFRRPKYQKASLTRIPILPVKQISEPSDFAPLKCPSIKTPSMKMQELKAVVIWEGFFKACEDLGKELVRVGAIRECDLVAWQNSKNKIVNIGLPSYVFLQCFIHSIKSGSAGFVMHDNVELTSMNRPEGRIFYWLFEPMLILKEQIRVVDLDDTEEKYIYSWLSCGDAQRVTTWQNGGVPPADEVERAHLVGLSRRLHGFSLTLPHLPTFRRRMEEVVKALLQEARKKMQYDHVIEETSKASHVEGDIL
ncbi:putative membrane protein [Dioscorea sansibarensis]